VSRGLPAIAALALLLVAGCPAERAASRPPEPAFFAPDLRFEGAWFGEVDGHAGRLVIERLGAERLRGLFESDDRTVLLVLLIEIADTPDGAPNVAPFSWQDGRGGRGRGWLRINRDNDALDGAYGYGERVEGAGPWLFVRAR